MAQLLDSHGTAFGLIFSQRKEIYGVFMGPKEDMREVVELMKKGCSKPVVDRTFTYRKLLKPTDIWMRLVFRQIDTDTVGVVA
ncbi:MAG: hypothetical protein Ct9H300mP11_10180 [Chloroflexota bacterium]|nr:MAG: hypothetical protein Ct9H300mP11_10180 [Chloroflexota bacterium]